MTDLRGSNAAIANPDEPRDLLATLTVEIAHCSCLRLQQQLDLVDGYKDRANHNSSPAYAECMASLLQLSQRTFYVRLRFETQQNLHLYPHEKAMVHKLRPRF